MYDEHVTKIYTINKITRTLLCIFTYYGAVEFFECKMTPDNAAKIALIYICKSVFELF